MWRNSENRYGLMARLLHWLSAACVLAAVFFVEISDFFERGSAGRGEIIALHASFGILVGLLLLPRLAWRLGNPLPRITPPPSAANARLASLGHLALYGLMLALPLLGVLMLQAGGKPVALFGWPLPLLIGADEGLRHTLKDLHELAGNLLIITVGGHIAAAIWHHRFVGDDTLKRLTGPRA